MEHRLDAPRHRDEERAQPGEHHAIHHHQHPQRANAWGIFRRHAVET